MTGQNPVDDQYVPTWDALFELWMKKNPRTGGNYASVPEMFEYELGFLKFYEDVRNNRALGLTPRGRIPSSVDLSTPEGNQP